MSTEYDVRIKQNTAWLFKVTVNDKDNSPVDLTGYAGEFVIRKSMRDRTAVFRTSNVTFGDTTHNVQTRITATESDLMPTGNEDSEWVYQLLIWDPNDRDNTARDIAHGMAEIVPSASRPDDVT